MLVLRAMEMSFVRVFVWIFVPTVLRYIPTPEVPQIDGNWHEGLLPVGPALVRGKVLLVLNAPQP